MLPSRAALVAVVSLAGTLSLSACSAQAPEAEPAMEVSVPDRTADEAAVRGIVTAGEAALNARDFAAFGALFRADGDAIVGDSPKVTGPAAVDELMTVGWSEVPAEGTISTTVDSVRFLADDVAVADVSADFGGGMEPPSDRATFVVVRGGTGWQVVTFRVYPAMAGPATMD